MSLDPPTYLSSLQNNVRQRAIPWDGAVRAGTISDEQLSKIRAVDKVRKEQRKTVVEGDIDGYTTLFVGGGGKASVLESASKRADVVQYILVLLNDLVEGTFSAFILRACLLTRSSTDISALSSALVAQPDPYSPFLPLLKQSTDPESPIPLLTSTVLKSLLAVAPASSKSAEAALPKLFAYLSTLTKLSDGGLQDIAVLAYSALLRGKKSRELFWAQRKETVGPLVDILQSAAGVSSSDSSTLWSGGASVRNAELGGGVGIQLLYHVLLVLWQLSFEGANIGDDFNE